MSSPHSLPFTPDSSLLTPHRWLVTGGCGFIGTSLIKALIKEGGHVIRVVDNLSVGTRDDLARVCNFTEFDLTSLSPQSSTLTSASHSSPLTPHPSPQLIVGDILDDRLALKAAQGMDVIVHLAANTGVGPSVADPRSDCVTNVIGTFNYLEAARQNQVKRFVFASSGAPVGECEPPIHEDMAPHPVSPYGASKLAGEGYCSAYFRTFGIETVALRFGNVYGPGSGHKNSVVAKFIRQAMCGETLEIYGDGGQTRDFIYIDDLVRAIRLAAIVDGIGGEVFQIATNAETTVSELANILLSILADTGINNVEIRYEAPRAGDVRRNFSDTSKALQVLGWQTKVSLIDGLGLTVKWFIEQQSHSLSP
ncbi:epimerase [Candidatus Fermentibacteria bacterium]|nr:MAG: epimerase [Candidatus Fermentibacteria bacterium]